MAGNKVNDLGSDDLVLHEIAGPPDSEASI